MPQTYGNLDRLFVAGEWREGAGDTLESIGPWDERVIFAMNAATPNDVDEACRAAADAQREWGALPPSARAAKMGEIADVMEHRKDENAEWIVREVGGTKVKAALELQLASDFARKGTVRSLTGTTGGLALWRSHLRVALRQTNRS